MAKFKMTVSGLNNLIKRLDQAPQKVTTESAAIIYDTAVEIENKAKNRVKVDTSALRTSIRATKLSNGASIVKAGLSNVSNAKGHLINYAAFVEFGTGKKPQTNYKMLDNSAIAVYAGTFEGKGLRRVVREPSPYLFNSADELMGKMVERIKKIRI